MLCHPRRLLASPTPPGRSHRPWRRAFWALNVLAPSARIKLQPTEVCLRRLCTYSSESIAWPRKALFRSVSCPDDPRQTIPEGTGWRLGQSEATNVNNSWDGGWRWSNEWAEDGRVSDGLNHARGVAAERVEETPFVRTKDGEDVTEGRKGRVELSPAQYDGQAVVLCAWTCRRPRHQAGQLLDIQSVAQTLVNRLRGIRGVLRGEMVRR